MQYTTTESYAGTNKKNIGELVEALKKINHPGIKYSVYIMEDGKTFMHLDHFAGEAEHEFLQQLPEFKKFAAELWDSRMEVKPKLDLLSVVGSTVEFPGWVMANP